MTTSYPSPTGMICYTMPINAMRLVDLQLRSDPDRPQRMKEAGEPIPPVIYWSEDYKYKVDVALWLAITTAHRHEPQGFRMYAAEIKAYLEAREKADRARVESAHPYLKLTDSAKARASKHTNGSEPVDGRQH